MSRFIKCLCIPALAIAFLAIADAPSADAGNGFSMRVGGLGIHAGHGHGHHGFRPTIRRVYPIHGGHGGHFGHRPYWHDTSHLDYHAPQIVPHGNHYDFVPGHYDVHRTGHWH